MEERKPPQLKSSSSDSISEDVALESRSHKLLLLTEAASNGVSDGVGMRSTKVRWAGTKIAAASLPLQVDRLSSWRVAQLVLAGANQVG